MLIDARGLNDKLRYQIDIDETTTITCRDLTPDDHYRFQGVVPSNLNGTAVLVEADNSEWSLETKDSFTFRLGHTQFGIQDQVISSKERGRS